MDTLIIILFIVLSCGVFAAVLSIFSPAERVSDLLVRHPMGAAMRPLEHIRDGSKRTLDGSWTTMKRAAASVGISGEHAIQRVIGSIMLSAVALASFYVDYLLARETFSGVFGTASADPSAAGLEQLIAVSIIASLFIWGALFFDSLKMTHITIFSGENIAKWFRYCLTAFSLAGFVLSVWMLAMLGLTRLEALSAPIASPSQNEEVSAPLPSEGSMMVEETASESDAAVEQSVALPPSMRTVMVGIPVISAASGLFSAVAFIPAAAMLLAFPVFLVVGLVMGTVWGLSSMMLHVLGYVVSFGLALVAVFAPLGAAIGKMIGVQSRA